MSSELGGTALQAGRLRVRFLMVSLEIFIDIILPAALWPWGRLKMGTGKGKVHPRAGHEDPLVVLVRVLR